MNDHPVSIPVTELDRRRKAGEAITILDVREPWELDIARFEGALAIPLMTLPTRVGEVPTDRPVVVVCHHGMRSFKAMSWLRQNGVANAINLEGGIDAWARQIEPTMGVY
ncbi:MAG TPA: rhodanese-like domain-containing protein [Aliidongia sp.]|nr:rhodanese-like domain-containing protein [Aliidongia sp.]